MMEVVDICVSMIYRNGAYIYGDKKEFVMRAIQNLVDIEKHRSEKLAKKINKYDLEEIIKQFNINRYSSGSAVKFKEVSKQQQPTPEEYLVKTTQAGGNRRKNA